MNSSVRCCFYPLLFPVDMTTEDGVMVTGALGNVRHKRSPRVGNTCLGEPDDNPNHAVTVGKGETIHIPCHSCNTSKYDRLASMQWMKLNYSPNRQGLYRVHEIIPGLHLNQKKNRIKLSVDHTLSIKLARLSDAGSYFCKPPDKKSFLDLKLSWQALRNYIANYSHIQFFYHVDVVELTPSATIDVSVDSENKPREPEAVPGLNIVTETTWHTWSSCNVCDDEGVRKRVGLCTIRKLKNNCDIPNKYLKYILSFSTKGLPCKSQFLTQFANEKWLQRPDEYQREDCFVSCPPAKSKRRKRSIKKLEMLKPNNMMGYTTTRKVKVGNWTVLACPGTKVGQAVVWTNASTLLPETTIMRKRTLGVHRKLLFDLKGNMHFLEALPSDTGEYSCWVENKLKQTYSLIVEEEHSKDVVAYLIYLLYSFVFDFAVFVFLGCARVCNKKVQRIRKKKKDKKEKEQNEEETEEPKEEGTDAVETIQSN